MKYSKNFFLGILIILILLSTIKTISATDINDDKNDVYLYEFDSETGYTLSSENVEDRAYIDIIGGSYEINGKTLTMSITLAEEIPPFSTSSTCSYVLYYGETGSTNYWHTATYVNNGVASYQTIEGGVENIGTLADSISEDKKTFTATFNIQTTDPDFEFWATATEIETEINTIDPENPDIATKTYIDVAPINPGDWSGSLFYSPPSSQGNKSNGSPGFEVILLFAAIGFTLVFLKRKK